MVVIYNRYRTTHIAVCQIIEDVQLQDVTYKSEKSEATLSSGTNLEVVALVTRNERPRENSVCNHSTSTRESATL